MPRPPAVALVALALVPAAQAEVPAASGFARSAQASLSGSLNPLGVQNTVELAWRRPLSSSASPLLANAHLSLGVSSRLTPAYGRAGAWVELAPLSILEVRAGAEPVGYFGTFHSLLPFAGYDEPFDDDTRKSRPGAEAGLAARLYLSPAVKARVGRLLVRSRADFERWSASAPGPFFYEPFRDTLLRSSGDALVASETLLLWSLWDDGRRKLLLGPVHDLTLVFDAPQNRRQDLGLLGIWGLGGTRFGLREPVVFVKVVRYLEEPNREGRVAAQVAVGFGLGKAR
jgi:hypothetical protein